MVWLEWEKHHADARVEVSVACTDKRSQPNEQSGGDSGEKHKQKMFTIL